MADGTGPTAALAAWIAGCPPVTAPGVLDAATDGFRDVIACMFAGACDETPRRVEQGIGSWGAGRATVFGSGAKRAAPWAALVNGTAAHVLDYDDIFAPLSGHATAVLVPAILAAGEEDEATGRDALDALAVGLEIVNRIGTAANPRHYKLGWHATATIGTIGAAAAVARLMRLDAEASRNALSLAVSMAAGTRIQLGAMAKSLHAGLAAKNGILAARLAASGVAGAEEALEGQWCFADLYGGHRPLPASIQVPQPGDPFAVETVGLAYKIYPTCGSTHLTLDSVLKLREREGLAAGEVAEIDTLVPSVHYRNLMHPRPTTGMEARFSMEYSVATALTQGRVELADFEGEAIHRPEIRDAMTRVTMRSHPPGSDDDAAPPTIVTIRLRDGRTLTDRPQVKRGSPASPMSAAEKDGKFRDCASRALRPGEIEAAARAIDGLSRGTSLSSLMSALVPRPAA